MDVTKKIKYLIVDKNTNITKLAQGMGISQPSLSYKFINNAFSVNDLVKIAEATDTDLEINFVMKNGNKI